MSPCQKSGEVEVVMSFQSPWMMQFLPTGSGSAARGETFTHIKTHTSHITHRT